METQRKVKTGVLRELDVGYGPKVDLKAGVVQHGIQTVKGSSTVRTPKIK